MKKVEILKRILTFFIDFCVLNCYNILAPFNRNKIKFCGISKKTTIILRIVVFSLEFCLKYNKEKREFFDSLFFKMKFKNF